MLFLIIHACWSVVFREQETSHEEKYASLAAGGEMVLSARPAIFEDLDPIFEDAHVESQARAAHAELVETIKKNQRYDEKGHWKWLKDTLCEAIDDPMECARRVCQICLRFPVRDEDRIKHKYKQHKFCIEPVGKAQKLAHFHCMRSKKTSNDDGYGGEAPAFIPTSSRMTERSCKTSKKVYELTQCEKITTELVDFAAEVHDMRDLDRWLDEKVKAEEIVKELPFSSSQRKRK